MGARRRLIRDKVRATYPTISGLRCRPQTEAQAQGNEAYEFTELHHLGGYYPSRFSKWGYIWGHEPE